jgi:hypothetical protein
MKKLGLLVSVLFGAVLGFGQVVILDTTTGCQSGQVPTRGTDGRWTCQTPPSGAVSSIFGRTAAVVAATDDYSWTQIASKPSTFPPSSHSHAIVDTTGLQTVLDGKQASLGFTPENAANKNASGGYAGLSSGSKITASQISAVLACADLTNPGTGCSGAAFVPHVLLGTSHSDTTSSAAVRGGGIFAIGASPLWTQVAHSTATGGYWKWNGTDIVASTNAASGTGSPTSCTNQVVTGLTLNADAAPTSTCTTVTNAFLPNGLSNANTSQATPGGAAGTYYYIPGSNINGPATYLTTIASGTVFRWHFVMGKTAAGTGAFNIRFLYGTNGTVSDTTIATQSVGTATAVIDELSCDATLAFTSATAGFWSLACDHIAATATGFGLLTTAVNAKTGTFSGLTTTTGSLKFGLAYSNTTGTAVITTYQTYGQAFNWN